MRPGRAAVQTWLSAVPHDGAGTDDRVVAVGALPFDRSAPGTLVVPVLTIRVDADGGARATLVATTDDEKVLHAELANLLGLARDVEDRLAERDDEPSPTLVEVPPGAGYADAVAVAVADIAAGRLDKVVLARSIEARFPAPPDLGRVVGRLRRQEPSCTTFSLPVPGGRFVGATPELLVRRRQPTVTCHPLAGTVGLRGDAGGDDETVRQLLASAKDRREHRLVVDDIAAVLGPRCAELRVPDEPSLVRFRSVAHLGTAIQGTLLDDEPVLDLLAALHPTPAVGGVPLAAALGGDHGPRDDPPRLLGRAGRLGRRGRRRRVDDRPAVSDRARPAGSPARRGRHRRRLRPGRRAGRDDGQAGARPRRARPRRVRPALGRAAARP